MDAAAAGLAGEEPPSGEDDGTEGELTDIEEAEEAGSASAEQASTMQVESPPEAASLSSSASAERSASAEPGYVTPVKSAQPGTLFNYFAKK